MKHSIKVGIFIALLFYTKGEIMASILAALTAQSTPTDLKEVLKNAKEAKDTPLSKAEPEEEKFELQLKEAIISQEEKPTLLKLSDIPQRIIQSETRQKQAIQEHIDLKELKNSDSIKELITKASEKLNISKITFEKHESPTDTKEPIKTTSLELVEKSKQSSVASRALLAIKSIDEKVLIPLVDTKIPKESTSKPSLINQLLAIKDSPDSKPTPKQEATLPKIEIKQDTPSIQEEPRKLKSVELPKKEIQTSTPTKKEEPTALKTSEIAPPIEDETTQKKPKAKEIKISLSDLLQQTPNKKRDVALPKTEIMTPTHQEPTKEKHITSKVTSDPLMNTTSKLSIPLQKDSNTTTHIDDKKIPTLDLKKPDNTTKDRPKQSPTHDTLPKVEMPTQKEHIATVHKHQEEPKGIKVIRPTKESIQSTPAVPTKTILEEKPAQTHTNQLLVNDPTQKKATPIDTHKQPAIITKTPQAIPTQSLETLLQQSKAPQTDAIKPNVIPKEMIQPTLSNLINNEPVTKESNKASKEERTKQPKVEPHRHETKSVIPSPQLNTPLTLGDIASKISVLPIMPNIQNSTTLTSETPTLTLEPSTLEPKPIESENSQNILAKEDPNNESRPQKSVMARQAMQHFSQSLKEQVENYKAPFMKLSMVMNPESLGKVEVTLLNRGNNIHVKINASETTLAFFAQYGNELKVALNDLGFNDAKLSYTDQSSEEKESQNRDDQQQKEKNREEDEEMELILPDTYEEEGDNNA
jgi:hypothetical protein